MRTLPSRHGRRRFGRITTTASRYALAGLALGYTVPRIEGGWLGAANAPLQRDQVIAFLSAVSSGMMAFTGIAFALLFIVLQFSSTAYSPQLVPILARNRTLAHASGVFTGTFLYSLMALRGVGAAGGHTTTLTIWTAFLWLIASVYLLLRLVRVFSSLTLTDVLHTVSEMGHREIDRIYGSPIAAAGGDGPTQTILHRGRTQYVNALDVVQLVAIARENDVTIHVAVAVGDPISTGTCLATVEGVTRPVDEAAIRSAIVLGPDRTVEQGPKQALRMLVDIAIRALSPAINDPTSAVRVLDQVEGLLGRLGMSHLEIGRVHDAAERLRLVYPAMTWEAYLDLGLTEIQQYGAGSVQVERRLAALLGFLRATVPEERRGVVEKLARERLANVRREFTDGIPRMRAEVVDRQGLGHPALDS